MPQYPNTSQLNFNKKLTLFDIKNYRVSELYELVLFCAGLSCWPVLFEFHWAQIGEGEVGEKQAKSFWYEVFWTIYEMLPNSAGMEAHNTIVNSQYVDNQSKT